jgi:ribosomal protein L11 methyltransferase
VSEQKAHWLEVSLTVNGELAEAVSEVISRYVSGGVVTESGVRYNDEEDEGTAYGPVKVYGFIPVDDSLEDIRHQLEEGLWHLGQIQALPQPQYRTIQDENWMASWKKHYHPIPIGQKLLVLPPWVEEYDHNRIPIRIDPSMAFGTGTHPTTQLCLELVEKYTRPGKAVIDVGCGSGILSIAALKLGASHALGVDIDRASVISTRENAAANEVDEHIECGQGSVIEILTRHFSLRRAPLVLANILAPVIVRLFGDGLAKLVSPGGIMVLSGILVEQASPVEAAALQNQLKMIESLRMGDWIAMAFTNE